MKTVRLQIWLSRLIKDSYFTLNAKGAIVEPQNNCFDFNWYNHRIKNAKNKN